MKVFVASSMFTVAAANNLFVHEFDRCVDIKILCEDGTDTAGCERQSPASITKGANLQLWDCSEDDNQNFELIGGRLRNKETGLCLDIQAECLDGSDTPGCERQSVSDIEADANVQLWTCRTDDAAGKDSNSYGNQKWDFLSDGTIKNVGSGLCLTAGGGKTDTSGRNLHVHTCTDSPGQIFDYEPPAAGRMAHANASTSEAPATAPLATQAPVAPTTAPLATQAPVAPTTAPLATQAPVTAQGSMPANLEAAQAVGGEDASAALSTGLLNSYSRMQVVHPGWIMGAMGAVTAAVALFAHKRRSSVPADVFESLTTSE